MIRPAATTICLRDGAQGLEVLLVRRTSKLAFYGGAWVFPGGRVDPEDASREGIRDDDAALYTEAAARHAAVREAREEARVELRPEALIPLSHWTTPPGRPRRFATWFFVAHVPTESVEVDAGEIEQHHWFKASEALSARDAGQIELPPPTFVTLDWATDFGCVGDALNAARKGVSSMLAYAPRIVPQTDGAISLYEGDAGYTKRDPDAKGTRHRLWMSTRGWRYDRLIR